MGIRFQNVSFSYDKIASETLKDVNLEINRENEFITILGHTGSGKSTLVQLMNALNLPHEGMVEVAGIKIYPKNKELLKPIRRHVGLVFQCPEYQLFEETVIKDVMFGPKNFLGKNADVLEEAKVNTVNTAGFADFSSNTVTLEEELTVPAELTGYKFKVFVFDSEAGLAPLANMFIK